MRLTKIRFVSSGLYEWGGGFVSRRHAEAWDGFWKNYRGNFWKAAVEGDCLRSAYLVSIYGGGMIHPMDFDLVVAKPPEDMKMEIGELKRALDRLAEEAGFTYTLTTVEMEASVTSPACTWD